MVSTTKAIGIGVVILFIAFAFPQFITGAEQSEVDTSKTITGGIGDSVQFEDAIIVTLRDKTANTVDLGLTSVVTGDNTTVTLTESESQNVQLDNQTVTVTALDVQGGTGGDVTVRVNYPNNFAWGDGAISISENLPVVFAGVALVIVAGLVGVVVRQ